MDVVFFIIIVILGLETCEFIYKQTKHYKKYNEQNIRLKSVTDNLEVVNIGSGPVYYGIDYRYCQKRGYNLATAPQNFLYGFKLLKHFKSKISKDANVIITIIAPMSFGYNIDIFSRGYSDKYYGILSSKEIVDYSFIRKLIVNHPLTIQILSKFKRLIFLQEYSNVSNSKSVVQTWCEEFGLIDLYDANQTERHLECFEEKIDLLEDMVQYIRDNGWNPIILIPPIPLRTREKISDEFLDVFIYQNLEALLDKVGEIEVVDYYDDARFGDELFENDIFLNRKGSEVFSRILFRDLEIGK